MRVDFVRSVRKVMAEDPQAVFLSGDLGFAALEELAKEAKSRFINAGVAEQGMMGIAAGLALAGQRPWVYSIAPFATYRCFEQIRNDVCLHKLPVRIVGNGGGYTYGMMGSTHHALEDLGILKGLPNMTLFFPCANDHVTAAVELAKALPGPSYLRLSISGFTTPATALTEDPVTLTRHYARGERWTIVGMGHGVHVALAAQKEGLLPEGTADVFGVARFPFNLQRDAALRASLEKTKRLLVVEEHYAAGGMGESFLRVAPRVERFELLCPAYHPEQRYGSPRFHLTQSGVTPQRLAALLEERA